MKDLLIYEKLSNNKYAIYCNHFFVCYVSNKEEAENFIKEY